MDKEYGKLSADQFRRLIGRLPEMKESIRELPGLLRTSTFEKLRAVLKEGVFWAPMYELSFAQIYPTKLSPYFGPALTRQVS
jgi:hypothetical protein